MKRKADSDKDDKNIGSYELPKKIETLILALFSKKLLEEVPQIEKGKKITFGIVAPCWSDRLWAYKEIFEFSTRYDVEFGEFPTTLDCFFSLKKTISNIIAKLKYLHDTGRYLYTSYNRIVL